METRVGKLPLNPEALLFTDRQGNPAALQDVIDDGMDGGYEDRIPGLVQLMTDGTPYHRLLACQMLTSWGNPTGFQTLVQWASQPEKTPWAADPVTVDRLSGADSAFESLADGLRASFWSQRSAAIKPLQLEAARALIRLTPTRYLGRTLMLAVARDPGIEAAVKSDVEAALEDGLLRIQQGERPGFDLGFQLASLLGSLVPYDDTKAAEFADRLVKAAPLNERMLKTLIDSLARGRGPATLAALERLNSLGAADLSGQIRRAIARRSAS